MKEWFLKEQPCPLPVPFFLPLVLAKSLRFVSLVDLNPNFFTDHEWKAVVQELSLLKEEVDRLREDIGDVKLHFKQV